MIETLAALMEMLAAPSVTTVAPGAMKHDCTSHVCAPLVLPGYDKSGFFGMYDNGHNGSGHDGASNNIGAPCSQAPQG